MLLQPMKDHFLSSCFLPSWFLPSCFLPPCFLPSHLNHPPPIIPLLPLPQETTCSLYLL